MILREASKSDIPQMLALWRSFWPPQPYEQNLERKIETDRDLVLIAESNATLMGTVIGGFDGWWAWIYRVAVSPNQQHKGVATALICELHKRLAARGADGACLLTDPANEKMTKLLSKLGYRPRDDRRYSFLFPDSRSK